MEFDPHKIADEARKLFDDQMLRSDDLASMGMEDLLRVFVDKLSNTPVPEWKGELKKPLDDLSDIDLPKQLNELYLICDGIKVTGADFPNVILGRKDLKLGRDLMPKLSNQVEDSQKSFGEPAGGPLKVFKSGGSDAVINMAKNNYYDLIPLQDLDDMIVIENKADANVVVVCLRGVGKVERGMVIDIENTVGTLHASVKHWLSNCIVLFSSK